MTKTAFYSGILQGDRTSNPSMKEARRDLDRAFLVVRSGALSSL